MKKFLLSMLIISFTVTAHIKVVLTAAITDDFYEFRKAQYLETFSILSQYGYKDFYIVEALKKRGPTFLDDYSSKILYAQSNNPSFRNNGINEAATFLEALRHFQFEDDDMIIKFTGRHQLTSDYFLQLVENNPEYDAFVKVNEDGNVFTLGFAMKYKYFIEMFGSMNFAAMGNIMRPIEYDVGDYIKTKVAQGNFKVYYVPQLYMKAQLYGSSTAPGVQPQLNYY